MHAIVIGSTGATGNDLLGLLLNDNYFQHVDVFVRREIKLDHPKLKAHIIDFNQPEQWKHRVKGDVLFSCLGTTLKAAGSKESQWKIDFDYQYEFAKAAKENGIAHYILVSSAGANPNSFIFYSKMKGKLEAAVKALNFPSITIFKPPLLIRKNTSRSGEITGMKVIQFLNKLGLMRSQKPLPTLSLAQAMIKSAKDKNAGIKILEGQQIEKYLRSAIV